MRQWFMYLLASGVFTGRSWATAEPVQLAGPPGEQVEAPPPGLAVNTPADCGAWRADAGLDWRAWRVQAGALVPYTPPPPPLAKLKEWKWRQMRAAAQGADQANITVAGHEFEADADNRAELFRQLGLAREAIADGQAYSLTWDKADGSTVTLSAVQLRALCRAIDARTQTIKTTLRARRAAIAAADTAEAVQAIQW